VPIQTSEGLLLQMRSRDWAIDTDWSRDSSKGVLLLSAPLHDGGGIIAELDVSSTSDFFLRKVNLSEQGVFSILGPQKRIILYRNPNGEAYLGKDMSDSPFLAPLSGDQSAVIELESPIDGVPRVYGLARAGETECVVMVGMPKETLYAPARRQLNRYLGFSAVGLALALFAALVIARSIAQPIRQLTGAARSFGAGDLSRRASLGASGELEELRRSFNAMASGIEEREKRLTELDRLKSDFVGSVSHEMRTPLTTIKTLTRVLLRGNVTESDRREFLNTIMTECDRQIDLILNLLDLSRIEAGTFNIALSRVEVADIVESCVKAERVNAEARGHGLFVKVPESVPAVLADGAALRRVLCGLVQNAIKYTADGGRIILETATDDDKVTIRVSDNGPGILEEDIPHIFDKFYRGHPAHEEEGRTESDSNLDVPGVGLGLYLARIVVEEIGGRITVESDPGVGSTFTVTLPVWDKTSRARMTGPANRESRNDEASARCR
ncbi:MAG TPA: ATP-binding protein, partial [Blastocatellia bacterium]|nr:ATP-binding protein [Blastocatellia bacterium]